MTLQLPVNTFKSALADDRCQIGIWSMLGSAPCVELLGYSGFDWMLLDMEHGPIDLGELRTELVSLGGSPTSPVVRVKWNDKVEIKRVLDLGAQTIMVPHVQTEEEAKGAVAALRYPPEGVRGVAGGTRATKYGRVKDYYSKAASELCLILQVESRQGIENLEAIVATDGVDAIFIGPSDLSASYGAQQGGTYGQAASEEVRKAIEEAISTVHRCGKRVGTIAVTRENAKRMLELNVDFLAVGIDVNLLSQSADKLLADFER